MNQIGPFTKVKEVFAQLRCREVLLNFPDYFATLLIDFFFCLRVRNFFIQVHFNVLKSFGGYLLKVFCIFFYFLSLY